MTLEPLREEYMWTWILIAIAVAAGLVILSSRRKNSVDEAEAAEDTGEGTDQLADVGTDSEYRGSSAVLRPLPDADMERPDPLPRATLSGESGASQPYAQLLENDEMQGILGQWRDIQSEFVDEPRKAVQDADALVAELTDRLAQTSASEREQLEAQWVGGDDVSTEDLRQSLRLYRSFFERPYAQLLERHEMQRILGQWREIQADFVDEPRKAVQDADTLVADLMRRLAQTSADEREQLESQWLDGDDVSTEDLRQSLRLYRSFFERLVAA
jgi:hypothetical protein